MTLPKPGAASRRASWARPAAIAMVSAAIMLLQICVTRILSVLLWYHFAFLATSLAMLGVGAPGVWLSLVKPSPERLVRALLGAGVLIPVGLALIILVHDRFGPWAVVWSVVCLLPGVLCLGTAVCLLLLGTPGASVSRLYAFDLLGACVGALVVIPAMSVVPTPVLAAATGLLPLGACALLGRPARRVVLLGIGALLLGTLAWGRPFEIRHTKEHAEHGALFRPIYEKWTPTARLAVYDRIPWASDQGFQWGVGSKGAGLPPAQQHWLEQDGSAGTPILQWRGSEAELGYLLYDVTSAGYQLRHARRVAIIGAGGGRDIWTARISGAETIDAIELNPAIVAALRGRFAAYSGGVYDRPGVRAIVGDGRSVLARSGEPYDVIQLSMVDSWAATAAGAYALSENNLYTLEAYRLYYTRLSETGLVTTSRWMPGRSFGFELTRLYVLVREALRAEAVAEPGRHIAVVSGGNVGTVLMSRPAFSQVDLERLGQLCEERGFALLYPDPSASESGARGRWREPDVAAFRERGLILAPPTDDKPFFFQMVSPLGSLGSSAVGLAGVNAQSVLLLRWLMLAITSVTLVLFFSPFVLSRWLTRAPGFWRGSLYFSAIGVGFMLVEIAWLQRLVLYLGHPSHATTATLGALLLGAGAGSMMSHRSSVSGGARWGWLVAAAIVVVNALLSPVFAATLGWPLGARVVLAGAVLTAVGFLLGFCFPVGMRRFGAPNGVWYWALNGAASVLASVVSLALAMELGLSLVAYLAAGLYLTAWALFAVGARVERAA